jgi:hypothetical protein
MNPSALGWIKRYLEEYQIDLKRLTEEHTLEDFYYELKVSGFIYGTNIIPVIQKTNKEFKLTQEELAKVNLFTCLYVIYHRSHKDKDNENCLKTIIDFYAQLRNTHKSLFTFKWKNNKNDQEVESILHQRIQTTDTFIQKNFSNIVTNALLFVDVLSFIKYLNSDIDVCKYATRLEEVLVDSIYLALKEKKLKGKYDKVIIRLVQSSMRYHQIDEEKLSKLSEVNLSFIEQEIEKFYILDMMCMTLYSDEEIDENEKSFINNFSEKLEIDKVEIDKSLNFLYDFVHKNKSEIYYFNISNPVKYFYDKTHRSVSILIHRNRKRIIQEISESKELMHLLVLSSYRELNSTEKKKVKSQLLDIFKTIPSLTIFALPGGTLLLPIIIKLIPTILPSAFNENLKESEKK